jgi:hypothetical protein
VKIRLLGEKNVFGVSWFGGKDFPGPRASEKDFSEALKGAW